MCRIRESIRNMVFDLIGCYYYTVYQLELLVERYLSKCQVYFNSAEALIRDTVQKQRFSMSVESN